MINQLYFFILSFAISLLIGMERERSHQENRQAIGVRTFILFGLLGTMAAVIHIVALTVTLSLFVFIAILLGYLRSTAKRVVDVGLTTEIAAAVIFCIGFIIPSSPFLGVVLGGLVLIILLERKQLHGFSRQKLRFTEIEAGVGLALFAVGVLPVLPNYPIDPWQLFNPRFVGILITVIAAMQFGGYLALRIFGHRFGMAVMGFFGGLVSSTAVFATLPKMFHDHPALLKSMMGAAIFSVIGMLVEFIILVWIASWPLLLSLLWPILAMIVVGGVFAAGLTLGQNKFLPPIQPKNPLDFWAVIRLALFISVIMILITLGKRMVGDEAAQLIAFLGGLFELHSVTLTTASLYVTHTLKLTEAKTILAIAILASFVSKFFLLWILARNRFAIWTSLLLMLMIATGGVIYFL